MEQGMTEAKAALEKADYPAALRLLRPLAEADIPEAQCAMGALYISSEMIKRRRRLAVGSSAPRLGLIHRLYITCLLSVLMQESQTTPTDRAVLSRAAELRYRDAQRDLGCYFATGENGFPKDEAMARYWYGKAAEQGSSDAQYNYAFMLLLGEGGSADRKAAFTWFRKAADAGEEEARRFLEENPHEPPEPGASARAAPPHT
jgi:TPR repeat protein